MKILISEKISQNRYKTPEGFLVCLNCVLARTGKQTYTKSEVFGGDDETEIEIDRTAKEVFSPETLASFENKPLTIQHPDEDVNVDNYAEYAKGFIRNIRKGTVDGQEVMIGDIVVTDKEAIEKIENGELLDLSCGYDCDIQDEEHPQQRNIRGNHVALCEQGRAGIARIADAASNSFAKHVNELHDSANNEREFFYKCSVNNQYYVSADPNKIADLNPKPTNIWALEKIDGNFVNMDGGHMNYMNRVKGSLEAVKEYLHKKGQCINLDDSENSEKAKQALEESTGELEKHMTDAMETYKIHWIDIYAKSKGYSKDMWSYDFEVKASSVKEALQKLADKVALGGTGTANALIVSIHSNTSSYMYSGKLSYLLKTVNDSNDEEYIESAGCDDSIKDGAIEEKLKNFRGRYHIDHNYVDVDWNDTDDFLEYCSYRGIKLKREARAPYGYDRFSLLMSNDSMDDSIKDRLIEIPEEDLRRFEEQAKMKKIFIAKKGKTWSGNVHYQVEFDGKVEDLVKRLEELDTMMEAVGVPMTWTANSNPDNDFATAGVDLLKKSIADEICQCGCNEEGCECMEDAGEEERTFEIIYWGKRDEPEAVLVTAKDRQSAIQWFRRKIGYYNIKEITVRDVRRCEDSPLKKLDKTYEVKSKDEKGNTIVRYVKANSFIDAVKRK